MSLRSFMDCDNSSVTTAGGMRLGHPAVVVLAVVIVRESVCLPNSIAYA